MKILFVYGAFENLGIEYISAVLKTRGFHTKLKVDPMLFDDPYMAIKPLARYFDCTAMLLKDIEQYKPDLIAFSVVSSYFKRAVELAEAIKKIMPEVHICFGGIHPSSVPEAVLDYQAVDSVIIGEGEYPFLELAESLKRTGYPDVSIDNLCTRDGAIKRINKVRPYIDDLDKLPFPDKELYFKAIPGYYKGYTIITRRGCLNSCTFCCTNIWDQNYSGQKKIRLRSVKNVIDELQQASEKYGFKQLRINDDIFTYNREWLKEFTDAYKKHIDKPYCCFSSPRFIDDAAALMLKNSGCYQVCIGAQSINTDLKQKLLNRNEDNITVSNAIRTLKKHRLRSVVDNIFGFPGQTEEHIIESAKFYNENRPDRIGIFWLIYFPKLPITAAAYSKGILNDEDMKLIEKDPSRSANTLLNKFHSKDNLRYHWLLFLIIFLPRPVINLIINFRLYRFFPAVSPSFPEALYTIFAMDRKDIPRKRYYIRYMHFGSRLIRQKISKTFKK